MRENEEQSFQREDWITDEKQDGKKENRDSSGSEREGGGKVGSYVKGAGDADGEGEDAVRTEEYVRAESMVSLTGGK